VKAQSNFDRVRHSPPSLHPKAKRKSRWKALKDGRDRQECQDEKERDYMFKSLSPVMGPGA
jgi:hypothetical protein